MSNLQTYQCPQCKSNYTVDISQISASRFKIECTNNNCRTKYFIVEKDNPVPPNSFTETVYRGE